MGLAQTGSFSVSDGAATNSPQNGTVTVDVYDHASPSSVTGGTLSLGNIHVGYAGTVTSTNSNSVSNLSGTRVNLAGSTSAIGNLSLNSLSGLVQGGAAGIINASLANGQGVGAINESFTYTFADDSALNGASTNVGTATINVTGQVYSGLGVWNVNSSGSWNSTANWRVNGGVPGLDAGFTNTDSATFGLAATSANPIVSLDNVSPSLKGIVFLNSSKSYTIAQGFGGTIILNNGALAANLINTLGTHTISAPIELHSNLDATISAGGLTVSGPISETGGAKSLTVTGSSSGTLTLATGNGYTGGTTVSGGTLNVTNTTGSATGYGDVTVDSGATLSGTGKVVTAANNFIYLNGALVVGDSTLTSPLASDITLGTSGSGSTVLGSTGAIYFDLFQRGGNLTGTTAAADFVKLFGTLDSTLGGTLVITNGAALTGFAAGDMWTLFDLASGSFKPGSAHALDYSALSLGTGLTGTFDTLTGVFAIIAVPEPSRALLLMIGMAGLCVRRRRQ